MVVLAQQWLATADKTGKSALASLRGCAVQAIRYLRLGLGCACLFRMARMGRDSRFEI